MSVNAVSEDVSLAVEPGWRRLSPALIYQRDQLRQMMRRVWCGAGLGEHDRDRPLRGLIRETDTVLLKPNWVTHRNEGSGGVDCLYTHPEFVLACLEEVAAARPRTIIIGDAPIQSCRWDQIVTPQFKEAAQTIADRAGVGLQILDFRRTVLREGRLGHVLSTEQKPLDEYVLFDLGEASLLEPLVRDGARFRVGDYDPAALAATHGRGRHQYLLCRALFDVQVVLSLPKLKTHCKAGLTGALKNLVGLNGNKDYLPHYRFGGPRAGGDCYPVSSPVSDVAAWLEDVAGARIACADHTLWKSLARGLWFFSGQRARGGGWHGNDTVWRMVLDLNRIAKYGRANGTLSDQPQRAIYSLTDALVCGEGDGPLRPTPVTIAAVTWGSSPAACDAVHAALLRLDASHIPLLRESTRLDRWPLQAAGVQPYALVDGQRLPLQTVADRHGVDAAVATGWRGKVELGGSTSSNHPTGAGDAL